MIVAAALLAAAPGVADAERAFAAMAQRQGQWTAFRAYAAPDAIMFTPEPTAAQAWLKDRADPPVAVMWWPSRVFLSCDGRVAVSTGPWVRRGGAVTGYFTTVWRREPEGRWRWVLDHGDELARPRAAGDTVLVRRAACRGMRAPAAMVRDPAAGGRSHDGTLAWRLTVSPGRQRTLAVALWTGHGYADVIDDVVDTR